MANGLVILNTRLEEARFPHFEIDLTSQDGSEQASRARSGRR